MFDPFFYKKLSKSERLFVIAHEAWHCALLHFARTGDRDKRLANIAQDLEIHFVLMDDLAALRIDEPFVLPHDPLWKGLSFEEIYEKLLKAEKNGGVQWSQNNRQNEVLTKHGDGEGFDQRCEPNAGEKDGAGENQRPAETGIPDSVLRRRVETMREALAQAAIMVERKKGTLPAHIKGLVEELVKPKINWKALLQRFVTSAYGGGRRWLPPARRHVWQGLYLQSMRQERLNACVAVDTSGSCRGDLPRFFAELTSLLNSFGNYEITVIQCDAEVGSVEKYSSDRPMPKDYKWPMTGGGGTSFVPPFDYVRSHRLQPDIFIYVTDGYGDAPKKAPPYPVLWMLTAGGTENFVDWGSKARLEQ